MRGLFMIAASFAALTVAACNEAVDARTTRVDENGLKISGDTVQTNRSELRVAARLECPEREGSLRLATAAPDGRSCFYRSRDGEAEVELQLAALSGPADQRLKTLESSLRTLVPAAAAAAAVMPAPPEPPLTDDTGVDIGIGVQDDQAEVRLPGLRVDAQGERAVIRLPGVQIDADDGNAHVRVKGDGGESVTVRANDGGAEIRTTDNSHANGDIRSTYLLASDAAGPRGWRVAGYRAEGPGAGPLVIGVLRSRGRGDDDLMDELEDLIDRNVRN